MAKKKTATKAANTSSDSHKLLRFMAWAFIAGLWLLLAAALASYDPADYPSHQTFPANGSAVNWTGPIGAVVAYQLYLMIGPGVWVLMAGGLALLVAAAKQAKITQPVLRPVGVVLMALATSCFVSLFLPQGLPEHLAHYMPAGTPAAQGAGGLIAIFFKTELMARFGYFGTAVIFMLGFWIGAILAMEQLVFAIPRYLGQTLGFVSKTVPSPVLVGQVSGSAVSGALSGVWGGISSMFRRSESDETASSAKAKAAAKRRKAHQQDEDDDAIDEDAGGLGATESFDAPVGKRRKAAVVEVEEEEEEYEEEVDETEVDEAEEEDADLDEVEEEEEADEEEVDAPGAYLAEKNSAVLDADALREKIKKLPINFAPQNKKTAPPPREVDLSGYQFPPMDMLVEPEGSFTAEMEEWVRQQAEVLENALTQYRIDGEVVGIDSGPVITLYEIRLAPGTKVAALNAISSDLARSMMAQNIRIVANTVGKDTIGIEVPNSKKERVRLKELMSVNADAVAKMRLPMFLGKDGSGNPLVQDLSTMPHMLIAGTTGSGKSVCMNSIIMSFLLTKRPDELKLVLVDPKMVEMSMFKDIPHLMCPVVTEMGKAAAILEWATTKMDERYELLAEAGVRDIASYNGLGWDELKERMNPANETEEARIPKKLPYLVFIIDELADLMMTNKEVEGFIVRLAQKARAVGIHLILATQRPQANVVTGLIKGNMPCRVAFKVSSGLDSRIVLDQKGAELLLGQGDMLFLSPRSSELFRAQGTLVDDSEIRKCTKFLKDIAQQNFEPSLVQIRTGGADVDEEAAKDPLFDEAVRVVLQTKRGSVSLLQRRLTIGYSRSSRLIEAMANSGILGEYKGSQAREVNITLDDWEAMKAQMDADAQDDSMHSHPEPKDGMDDEDDSVPDEFADEYKN